MALLEARSRNFLCDSPIQGRALVLLPSGVPVRSQPMVKTTLEHPTRFLASAIQHVKTEVRCSCRIEEVENHLQRMRKQMAGRQAGTRQANLPRISSPPPQTPPSSTAASTWASGHGKAVSPRRRRHRAPQPTPAMPLPYSDDGRGLDRKAAGRHLDCFRSGVEQVK